MCCRLSEIDDLLRFQFVFCSILFDVMELGDFTLQILYVTHSCCQRVANCIGSAIALDAMGTVAPIYDACMN